MKIPVSKIDAGEFDMRSTQDDLRPLANSIKQQQYCAVMVRENGERYELIFGHRRLAAAKKARQKTIEAVVAPESMPDVDAMVAALAENLSREDVSDLDKGEALVKLATATKWGDPKIARRVGIDERSVRRWKQLVAQPKAVQQLMRSRRAAERISTHHVEKASNVKDESARVALLKQAAKTEMTAREVGKRADLLNRARTEEGKKRIIEAEVGAPYLDSRFVRAAERMDARRLRKKRKEYDPRVREVLDDLRRVRKQLPNWERVLKANLFSPEALRFTSRLVAEVGDMLEAFNSKIKSRIKRRTG